MASEDTIEIWHNPRCSKSRAALARLEAEFPPEQLDIVRYLDAAPSLERLSQIAGKIEGGAQTMLRAKEDIAKELGITEASSSEDILKALAAHPRLIQRPILIWREEVSAARSGEALDHWVAAVQAALGE